MADEFIAIEIDVDFTKSDTARKKFVDDMGKIKQSILEIREENKKLNKEFRETSKDESLSIEQQAEKRKQLSKQIANNEEKLKGLGKQQRENRTAFKAIDKTNNAYERQIAELTLLNNKIKAIKAEGGVVSKSDLLRVKELDDSLKQINGRVDKTKDAYEKLSAELISLRKKIKAIKAEGGVVSAADLARVDKLDSTLKDIDASVGQFQRNVGDYGSAFDGIFEKITGNIGGGFGDLIGSLKGAVNPVVAIGAGVVALGGYIADITLQYEKLNSQVSKATGLQGVQAREVTIGVKTIAETFQKDFTEVLIAANAFAKQTGIDFNESLRLIEEGFLLGADAQGDFLDNLREYPVLLKDAGLTAEDFIELQIRSQREGFFSDKLLDSVKEANLSLKEFTKTQRDALIPLGEEFADKLETGIADGTITTIDALTLIGKQVDTQGLNLRDFATITADVFKGAGEDAGGAAKVLEQVYATVNGSLEDLALASDAYTERQREQLKATKALSEAESDLAENFEGIGVSFSGAGAKIQTFFINVLNDTIKKIREIIILFKALGVGFATFSATSSLSAALNAADAFFKKETERAELAAKEAVQREVDTLALQKEQEITLTKTRAQIEEEKKLSEQRQKAAQKRFDDIQKLKSELEELNTFLGQTSQENRLDVQIDIDAVERQIKELGGIVEGEVKFAATPEIDTLNFISQGIDVEKELNKLKETERTAFLKKENEDLNAAAIKSRDDRIRFEIEFQAARKQIISQAIDTGLQVVQNLQTVQQNKDNAEIAALEERYAKEIELASGNTERQEELSDELDKKKAQIEQKAFERSKRLQLLEATINFQKGLTNILSLSGTDVFSTPILKGIQIAGLIAQYASSIAAITSAKFAKGTVLEGNSHERGGIGIYGKAGQYYGEAEGGEPILTKGTSRNKRTLGIASHINMKHGGSNLGGASLPNSLSEEIDKYISGGGINRGYSTPIPPRKRLYQHGGVTQSSISTSNSVDDNAIAIAVQEALKNVTIVVDVKDIIDETQKRISVVQIAQTS